MSRHASQRLNRTSTRPGRVSWSASTVSTSVGSTAPRARSGSSPRSTPTAPSRGPNWSAATARAPTRARPAASRSVARTLRQAGWRLERVLTDNGNEFAHQFGDAIAALGARQTKIRAGRPQTNGHVERLHRTILEECWRPAFARFLYLRYRGLQRELDAYLTLYNHHRAHTGRITNGRYPSQLVYGAHKMEPR